MSSNKLSEALSAIDWEENISAMMSANERPDSIIAATLHLAIWSKQLEQTDTGNPALCFVREMQNAAHNTSALIALGMYKPAAASMRSIIEGALYYTYFRTHFVELSTLVREQGFYLDKKEIIAFHKNHTPYFLDNERKLGVVSRLEATYSKTSAVIHGQIPGKWVTYTALAHISYDEEVCREAINTFREVVEIVRRLFLCTVAQELWHSFSRAAKGKILHGLSGDQKAEIGLDSA